jgi:phage-related protein
VAATVSIAIIARAAPALAAIKAVAKGLKDLKAQLGKHAFTVTPVLENGKFRVRYQQWRGIYAKPVIILVRPKLDTSQYRGFTAANLRTVDLLVHPRLDLTGFRAQWAIFRRVYGGPVYIPIIPQLGAMAGNNVVGQSGDTGSTAGRAASNRWMAAFRRTLNVGGFMRALRPLVTASKVVGKMAGVAVLAFAALGSSALIGNILYAFSSVAAAATGALGVIPALAVGAVVAIGTIKLATAGLGAAIGKGLAGDVEQFEKALAKLPPAAQDVARTVVGLKPQFDKLRASVAGAFFKGITGEIKALAGTYLPLVSRLTTGVATDMNTAMVATSKLFQQKSNVDGFAKAFDNIRVGLAGMTGSLPDIARAFAPLIRVGSTFLPALGKGFGGVIDRLADFMEKAEKSGALKGFIQGGMDALKSLGGVLGSVGSILKSVFVDARSGGEGMFAAIGNVLKSVADFLNTEQGMDAIRAVWDAMSTIGRELANALKVVLPAVGAMFAAIAPVIPPLAAAISGFLQALAPALPIVGGLVATIGGALVPVFHTLGPVIVSIVTALAALFTAVAPLIPVLAEIVAVVGKALAGAVTDLIPVLTPLITLLGDVLADAFTQLAPLIGVVAQAFGQIMTELGPVIALLVGEFVGVLKILVPIIAKLAVIFVKALAPIITALAPIFGILAEAIGRILLAVAPLLPVLAEFITRALQALIPVLEPIIGLVVELVDVFIATLLPALEELRPSFEMLLAHMATMTPLLGPLMAAFAQLVVALLPLLPMVTSLVNVFVTGLLPTLTNLMVIAVKVATVLIKSWSEWIGAVVRFTQDKLMPILTWLVKAFAGIGAALIGGLIEGVTSMFPKLKETFKWLTDVLPTWKGPASRDKTLLTGAGQSIMGGLIAGIRSQVPVLEKTLGKVTGVIAGISAEPVVTIATAGAVPGSAAFDVGAGRGGAVAAAYQINVTVQPGADPAEVGRQTVRAIEAWERRSGRRRLVAA